MAVRPCISPHHDRRALSWRAPRRTERDPAHPGVGRVRSRRERHGGQPAPEDRSPPRRALFGRVSPPQRLCDLPPRRCWREVFIPLSVHLLGRADRDAPRLFRAFVALWQDLDRAARQTPRGSDAHAGLCAKTIGPGRLLLVQQLLPSDHARGTCARRTARVGVDLERGCVHPGGGISGWAVDQPASLARSRMGIHPALAHDAQRRAARRAARRCLDRALHLL